MDENKQDGMSAKEEGDVSLCDTCETCDFCDVLSREEGVPLSMALNRVLSTYEKGFLKDQSEISMSVRRDPANGYWVDVKNNQKSVTYLVSEGLADITQKDVDLDVHFYSIEQRIPLPSLASVINKALEMVDPDFDEHTQTLEIRAKSVDFPDTSYGIPLFEKWYTQTLVHGFKVSLKNDRESVLFHLTGPVKKKDGEISQYIHLKPGSDGY